MFFHFFFRRKFPVVQWQKNTITAPFSIIWILFVFLFKICFSIFYLFLFFTEVTPSMSWINQSKLLVTRFVLAHKANVRSLCLTLSGHHSGDNKDLVCITVQWTIVIYIYVSYHLFLSKYHFFKVPFSLFNCWI